MGNRMTLCLAILAFLLIASANAEVYQGTVIADHLTVISADCSGTIEKVCVEPGDRIENSEIVAIMTLNKTFAISDGTVARVTETIGKKVEGTLIEVAPDDCYTIYCTVDDAYESVNTQYVHLDETVYIKCTHDGTHRGTGKIISIDNDEYRVQTDGGELYVGETVNLYRESSFSSSSCVGIGTVTVSKTVDYSANGVPINIYVSEGEYVEKGKLLFETVEEGNDEFISDISGIVIEVCVQRDERVEAGNALIKVVPTDSIMVEISVPETEIPYLNVGDNATICYACDLETIKNGKVYSISQIANDGYYKVLICPEESPEYIGMNCEVRIEQ